MGIFIQPVNIIAIGNLLIETCFVINRKPDQNAGCYAYPQAGNIYDSISLIEYKATPGGLEVIADHKQGVW
jgi:hypothetical protein